MKQYYFVYDAKSFSSLIKMLNDGFIYPNTVSGCKEVTFSGTFRENGIYTNIFFDDLKNIIKIPPHSIIIHPDVVLNNPCEFHGGWSFRGGPIYKINNGTSFEKTSRNIKNFLRGPSLHPPNAIGHLVHEVIFDKKISIKQLCIGICCVSYSTERVKKLQKIIHSKHYNIKLIDTDFAPSISFFNSPAQNIFEIY